MRRDNHKQREIARTTGPDEEQDANVQDAPDSDWREPTGEPDETSDLEEIDPDDPRWDAFIADDDERDPQPEYGDFWGSMERGARSREPD